MFAALLRERRSFNEVPLLYCLASRNVSGRWKIFLEQLQEICEKRLANSYYVTLFYKEYQESVRKQKVASHERVSPCVPPRLLRP